MYLVTVKHTFGQQCLLENENDIRDLQKSLPYCKITAVKINVGSYPMYSSPYYLVKANVDEGRVINIMNDQSDPGSFYDGQDFYCYFPADDPVIKRAVETRQYGQLLETVKEKYNEWLVNP